MNETSQDKRRLQGVVVSKKMQKTATVEIQRLVPHPVYKKYLKRSSRLHVHDEHDQCKVGEKVSIMQSRPISKLKAWKLVEIVNS